MVEPRIAGLELGGTKCLAILADGHRLIARESVRTTHPDETLGALDAILARWHAEAPLAALGIASFGPLGLDPDRADYGEITTTPKPYWAGTEILGRYQRLLSIPIGFDTDVTGAALAEYLWGGAQTTNCNLYLTIGTGIGGGAIVNGKPLRGLLHPEMGHIRVRRDPADTFPGHCPIHGDCLEGLVAGGALARRTGMSGDAIAADDPVWDFVADEIGELVAILVLAFSPQRIAFGGGVMVGNPALFPAIRDAAAAKLAGYVAVVDRDVLETLVAPASFGADAGPLGAIALGLQALGSNP